ncbi:hypothetical protein [uncultured Erythrobacter sp.]|uniref:hypothetical protein n=1 Tax=uncultured Erythrobacter sp. TaxID=263913 RepID=UPI00260BBF05|nr:hypothetical protein [uncultured Erythrobacter sp.]
MSDNFKSISKTLGGGLLAVAGVLALLSLSFVSLLTGFRNFDLFAAVDGDFLLFSLASYAALIGSLVMMYFGAAFARRGLSKL